jgi:trehalose synthase-fused probable maltokinase
MARAGAPALSPERLEEWLLRQRWFGAKARELSHVCVLDAAEIADGSDPLLLLIVEVRTPAGTHDLYQLPVGISRDGTPRGERICEEDGVLVYDALADERQTARLGELIAAHATVSEGHTTVSFDLARSVELAPHPSARRVSSEQSNSSVVLDDRYILKAFRRLEAGVNPELEMLSFLAEHGFENIAAIDGWYSYHGELLNATLGIMQQYIPNAKDGWQLVLAALERDAGDDLLGPLEDLGAVTGRMHATLASDPEDPEFAPEEPSEEHVALLTATIDEQIESVFKTLPERETLAPIVGRGEELRDRLSLLSHTGVGGRLIRAHGDYHLGQTLRSGEGWVVLDFEGEPGRPVRERRRKRSPLRDVAGMLRSFAYAATAGALADGREPATSDWEQSARSCFLEGYMATIDPMLLPAGMQAIEKQLAMFELEKLLYELRYELENRPDWLIVPVTGILSLLAEAP